jgi:catechol 2,3-dioxygenase-like lactoylglutathione lyase family enzyme
VSVRGIWHAGFSVRDIERSIAFYRDALGLNLRHRQVQDNPYTAQLVGIAGARLRVAQFTLPGGTASRSGHVLELIEYERPRGEAQSIANNAIGAAHLALEVEDIDAIRPRLEAAGATFLSDPLDITAGINRGGRTVYLRDPDGITLELVEPPPQPGAPAPADAGEGRLGSPTPADASEPKSDMLADAGVPPGPTERL